VVRIERAAPGGVFIAPAMLLLLCLFLASPLLSRFAVETPAALEPARIPVR
jgi:hypothetical protein